MYSVFQSLLSSSPFRWGTNTTPTTQTDASAYDQLLRLFEKIKGGIGLSETEVSFLNSTAKLTPSMSEKVSSMLSTPLDEESVQAINSLSERVLNRVLPSATVLDQVERRLLSNSNPSIRETASLARLVGSCAARDGSFDELLQRFRLDKGRDPTRGELIDMVAKFNKEVLPKISNAGAVVGHVRALDLSEEYERRLEIRYNPEGYLEINDGPIAPLSLCCKQVLSATQRAEMLELYKALAIGTPYNNLGELLEFIGHFKKERETDPTVTLQSAYDSYHPDLAATFDKYQSGTCILLSTKFCQELAKKGIQAQSLAMRTTNNWTSFPIPGTEESPIRWNAFSREISGADHTDAVCLFMDEDGREEVIKFACSFEKNKKDEIEEFRSNTTRSGLQRFKLSNGINAPEDIPNEVVDRSCIGKARLKGRFKALIMKDKMTLGIDFLRGNFFINPSWAKTMTGLPLNAKGMVSIELEDLANPDEKGIYSIDTTKVELSHREALRIILEKARSEMVLPEDTEENLIALAQNQTALMSEFLMPPLSLIKANFPALLAISKKMDGIKDNMERVKDYRLLQEKFDEAIEPLLNPETAEEANDRIARLKDLADQM